MNVIMSKLVQSVVARDEFMWLRIGTSRFDYCEHGDETVVCTGHGEFIHCRTNFCFLWTVIPTTLQRNYRSWRRNVEWI